MAVIWTGRAKPDMSKFPASSRLTRAGDGRWVVSGTARTPTAPAAAPATPGPDAAAIDSANRALPVDIGRSAQMASQLDALARLPGTYNPQRMLMAAQAVRQLTGSGLLENAAFYEAARTPTQNLVGFDPDGPGPIPPQTLTTGGDIGYGIHQGTPGRTYREAWTGVKNTLGAMGSGEGSAVRDSLAEESRRLDAARDDLLAQLATGQAGNFGEQQGEFTRGWADYMQGSRDYADWQASVPVTPPMAKPPEPKLPTVTTPGFPVGAPFSSKPLRAVGGAISRAIPGVRRNTRRRLY